MVGFTILQAFFPDQNNIFCIHLTLRECILNPGWPNIRSSIIQNTICFPSVNLFANQLLIHRRTRWIEKYILWHTDILMRSVLNIRVTLNHRKMKVALLLYYTIFFSMERLPVICWLYLKNKIARFIELISQLQAKKAKFIGVSGLRWPYISNTDQNLSISNWTIWKLLIVYIMT